MKVPQELFTGTHGQPPGAVSCSTHRSSAVLTGLFTVTEHHVPRDGRAAFFSSLFSHPLPILTVNGTGQIQCCIGSAWTFVRPNDL